MCSRAHVKPGETILVHGASGGVDLSLGFIRVAFFLQSQLTVGFFRLVSQPVSCPTLWVWECWGLPGPQREWSWFSTTELTRPLTTEKKTTHTKSWYTGERTCAEPDSSAELLIACGYNMCLCVFSRSKPLAEVWTWLWRCCQMSTSVKTCRCWH